MNKYEEALDDVINKLNGNYIPEVKQQVEVLQELVQRSKPIEVEYHVEPYGGLKYYCGVCKAEVESWHNYCWSCSQVINRSDVK